MTAEKRRRGTRFDRESGAGLKFSSQRGTRSEFPPGHRESRRRADVAQLVAHHLAKVRVAGSSPVIRSGMPSGVCTVCPMVTQFRSSYRSPAEWPSGLGKGLQSPVRGFDSRLRLARLAQWESATLTR